MFLLSQTMNKTSDFTLRDFIRVYDYDLSAEAEKIRGMDGWKPHTWHKAATGEIYSETEKELEVRALSDHNDVFNALMSKVADAIKKYADELLTHARVDAISSVRLNRYPTGSMMRAHADHIRTLFDGQAKGIPVLSVVGVLNDDYEGGDLIICGEPYRLKPGQIIVWPSCFLYPHEVTEITAGTRYSFVSWAW